MAARRDNQSARCDRETPSAPIGRDARAVASLCLATAPRRTHHFVAAGRRNELALPRWEASEIDVRVYTAYAR